MGFISLKYDFSFKNLMQNEEVRRYFISDALGIPVEEIRQARLTNPFLWKRFFKSKQGVLDVLVELNDDSKVNIELQIKMIKHWDKRNLFYLAKMFTEDLLIGEDYTKLKKCICISILDFNMDDASEYHKVYRLRDEVGREFSDMFEVHIIELGKKLKGNGQLDDWIRLFNAGSEEELDMIQTTNPGILAAIREVKIMSLGKTLRALYEGHMKEIRDRNAREEYVYDEGVAAGKAEGKAEDILQLLAELGTVTPELKERICAERDVQILGKWLKCAARARSIEEFWQFFDKS